MPRRITVGNHSFEILSSGERTRSTFEFHNQKSITGISVTSPKSNDIFQKILKKTSFQHHLKQGSKFVCTDKFDNKANESFRFGSIAKTFFKQITVRQAVFCVLKKNKWQLFDREDTDEVGLVLTISLT